jgi:hypothetical protein
MPRTPATIRASRHNGAPHLLDIAAQVPSHTLERALEQAERLQPTTTQALHEVIRRANGHRGTKRLTEAIAGDPQFTRGELEALMNKLARD